MKIATLTALFSAMTLASCAPRVESVKVPAVERLDDSLTPLFVAAREAKIVSFGEFHNHLEKKIEKNTAWYFYTTILPEMAKLGYKTIVLEALWSDIYPTELKIFNEKGKIHKGLSLLDNIRETPENNLEVFLYTCYNNHVKVVPSGIPHRFYEEATKDAKKSKDPTALGILAMVDGMMLQRIKKNTYHAILEAVKTGKVMSYGGMFHNNIDKEREKVPDPLGIFLGEDKSLDISFGYPLAKEFKDSYWEVDLVVPEVVKALPMKPGVEYILDAELAKGGRKVEREGNRFKIVFPR